MQWDHEGESFLVALDRKTGRELWRQKRDEETSWATPLVVEHAGRTQVVTSATNKVRSYDAAGGELALGDAGHDENAIPTPVHADGLVFLTSGFRGNALLAVKLDEAKGDIAASPAIAWKLDRDTPYVPSPLLYGDELYFLKGNNGLLSCLDAKTGERLYGPERLEGVPNVYASPVGAGGRVYVAGREGATAVVERGRAFKLLATNTLEDGFDASPGGGGLGALPARPEVPVPDLGVAGAPATSRSRSARLLVLRASFSGSSRASTGRAAAESAAWVSGRSRAFWYCCCGLSERQ